MNGNLLREKILEKGYNQKEFAKLVNITEANLSLVLNDKRQFSLGTIQKITKALKLTKSEVLDIFFQGVNLE